MSIVKIKTPIKVQESRDYGLVLEDADKITHFFKKDGSYDGSDKEVTNCKK